MKHITDKRRSVGHRLAIIEGHLRKVRRMVEQGASCIEIVHQSQAIQGALKNFDEVIIRRHVTVCVPRDLKSKGLDSLGRELAEIYKRL